MHFHKSPQLETAKKILSDLKISDKDRNLSAKFPPFQCLLGWLEKQQKSFDSWHNDPAFIPPGNSPPKFCSPLEFWNEQVAIHLELVKCLASLDPSIQVPPSDPKLLAALATYKDDDEGAAEIMAGLIMEFAELFSTAKKGIPPNRVTEKLQEQLAIGIVSNKFNILLRHAIDSENQKMLDWLIHRHKKIDSISEIKIDPALWTEAENLYNRLVHPKPVVSSPQDEH
jgi:hypothetical protein